ncbi:SbcC/MukB-like Walker B domain-containing protein [Sulfurovum mangrovi]|uniref:SbcC/MukB-like Walker B domain-containing protein n=1 Tax=Sulfurovum mangrovi TaxID=2893889 RepID=UPI001E28AF8F|nr:SbcC/MukB-like Walker B domain-containing protein [Sulfurovum mangrovi]UFH60386.1 hypothetical protein LN246_05905 [Sulfurovum mangrovi]
MSYKLHKAIGINFANLTQREFYFRGSLTLVSGENGAGKSTFQDLVQIVMTGDINNIINYNAGQSEDSTKKRNEKKRSFASYILGAEQMKFTREQSIGVVALVFENQAGSKFTAWIYGEAELEGGSRGKIAKGDNLHLGLCFDTELHADDFLMDETSIKEWSQLKKHLESGYKNSLLICESKKEYLMKLYGRFNEKSAVAYNEAEKMAKAFVKYIFPTKADNIGKFVRRELLEENDLSSVIESLREAIASFSRIQKEADDISKSEESLKKVLLSGEEALEKWRDHFVQKYLVQKRKEVRSFRNLDQSKSDLVKLNKAFEKERKAEEKAKDRSRFIQDEIDELNQNLEDNEQIARRNRLSKGLEDARTKKNETIHELYTIYDGVSNLYAHLSSLDQILPLNNYVEEGILGRLQDLVHSVSKKEIEIWTQKFHSLHTDLSLLLDKDSPLLEDLKAEFSDFDNRYKTLKEKTDAIKDDIEAFSLTGTSSYPNQADIAILKESCPEAEPRPLCELLDITNREWQGAIEGFMGNNRFAIVVKEGYETEATDLLKSRRLKSKIIQGTKLLSDMAKLSKEVKSDSIVSLVTFHSDIAEAYMKLNYANVMQCSTTYELTQARRGLKSDGLAASGYTTFECLADKSNCYIGEAARYERYVELTKQLDENEQKLSQIKAMRDKADKLYKDLIGVSFHDFNAKLQSLEKIETEISSLDAQMDSIDISDAEEKLARIKMLAEEKAEQEKQEKRAIKNTGSLETQIKGKENAIETLQREISGLQEVVKKQLENLRAVQPELSASFTQYLAELDAEAQRTSEDKSLMPIFDKAVKDLITKYENLVIRHNDDCAEIAKIEDFNFESVKRDTTEAFIRLHQYLQQQQATQKKISENILKKKNEELTAAKGTFDQTFKDEFCKTVYNSIIDGREKVKRLNLILKRHKFDNERFIIKEPFIQQFKEYYEYFEYVVNANRDSLGFDKNALPQEHIETKNKIEQLLLDTENSESDKELKIISDYRNYKAYDIHKIFNNDDENSVSLTDLATDSGGQATTSYYIIRSIAAYSAFNPTNRGNKDGGVGFLMVDEAFNRVDDGRTSDIIKYLKDDLGFQLIAAMPTKDESVLMPYASDRYGIYKVTEESSYHNFLVHQHVDYTIINNEEVNRLMKDEENRIRNEVSLFD